MVRGVWAELSGSGRQNQVDVLFAAIHAGIPVEEMEERINASERTRLLTGCALSAASRTAWEDKVRTLGRTLASGLLADDNAKIDTEQMIIAAIADIEGPQLAMLELLVAWRPGRNVAEPLISGPLDLPADSRPRSDGSWDVARREWPRGLIVIARPNLKPIVPSLMGTLQRHGLVIQNSNTQEAIDRYAQESRRESRLQAAMQGRRTPFQRRDVLRMPNSHMVAPPSSWSPTELGEKVYLRFLDAGTKMEDVWSSGPDDQQE